MVYEEVDIDDMDYDEETGTYTYECPCGDLFQITEEQLAAGEEIAHCPSCSLVVHVLYDPEDFMEASANAGARAEAHVSTAGSQRVEAMEPEPEPEPELQSAAPEHVAGSTSMREARLRRLEPRAALQYYAGLADRAVVDVYNRSVVSPLHQPEPQPEVGLGPEPETESQLEPSPGPDGEQRAVGGSGFTKVVGASKEGG